MKNSSACYHAITEDSVQCYSSFRNQCKPLYNASRLALTPLPTHSRKKKAWLWILCPIMLQNKKHICQCKREKKWCSKKKQVYCRCQDHPSCRAQDKRCLHSCERQVGGLDEVTTFATCVSIKNPRENEMAGPSFWCLISDMEARSWRKGQQGAFLVRSLA